jgi:hypothetical protein
VFQNPHQINGRKVDVKKALPKEETRGGAGIIYKFFTFENKKIKIK